MHTLDNGRFRITVKEQGAELTSIFSKDQKLEYLWQADPAYWARYSPVLFPVVGRLKEDRYSVKGQSYSLPQHGFARDKDFQCTSEAEGSLLFELREDEDTLKRYPYHFILRIGYRLEGSSLQVSYEVCNTNDKTMYFSIGGHPAFRCPLLPDESFSDYYLEFEKNETPKRWFLLNGLFNGRSEELPVADKKLPLNHDLFTREALVLKNLQSQSLSLKSSKHNHGLHFHFEGFPYLGIWTKDDAPFICLEPWYGLSDSEKSSGILPEKEGILSLLAGEWFRCRYRMDFF